MAQQDIKSKALMLITGYIHQTQTQLKHQIIPKEIVLICFKFYYIELPSNILSDDEKMTFIQLLKDDDKYNNAYNFKLLFRASTDGADHKLFRKKCNNLPNVLVIIESKNNNVFGGFTSKGWNDSVTNGYIEDDKAFLFSLRSYKYEPRIGHIQSDTIRSATGHFKGYICSFGEGSDIYIDNNWAKSASWCGKLSNTFDFPRSSTHYLNQSDFFYVTDFEVFQVEE